MKRKFISLVSAVLLIACSGKEIYKDSAKPVEERVEDLLKRLTLDEKLLLLSGDSSGMDSKPIARLGIPAIHMTDGPIGIRWKKATSFPSAQAYAATWDTTLIQDLAGVMAEEVKALGRDYLLGPCVCISRYPLGGRNFESYGEDPYLSSRLAVNWIKGLQSKKVIGSVKHFAMNDQEWERHKYDVIADERTMREIHLPMFEAAVKEGNVWTVMSAYNILNGHHCGENHHLLTEILKKEWGFKGFVISDWGSMYNTVNSVNAGLDLEMPVPKFYHPDSLNNALKTGKIKEEIINDKIRRILRIAFTAGLFDETNKADTTIIYSKEHTRMARRVAESSITLLKNENNILPLNTKKIKTIALIGVGANVARNGGGSSRVEAWQRITPLQGIQERVGQNIQVLYTPGTCIPTTANITAIPSGTFMTPDKKSNGLQAEYFDNPDLKGHPSVTKIVKNIDFNFDDKSPIEKIKKNDFSIRFTGFIKADSTGNHIFSTLSDDGVRLFINNKLILENWSGHAPTINVGEYTLEAGKLYAVRLEYNQLRGGALIKLGMNINKTNIMDQVKDYAKKADIAIVFAGTNEMLESEAMDVASMNLPENQQEIIDVVSKINPNTIVILNGGTPLYSTYLSKVKGLLQMYYAGQETGHALASILFGDVNPSGKLPYSYIKDESQCPAFKGYKDPSLKIKYDEGVFVGYRYLDKNNINPVFPFGFGLSYTTFEYSNIKVIKTGSFSCSVTFTIKNTGSRKGAETAQLYVYDQESSVERPLKELKGFVKVELNQGESKAVTIKLNPRDFSFWDIKSNNWKAEQGVFEILIGASSRDIKLKSEIVF